MREFLPGLLVLGCLVWIIKFTLFGGKGHRGRPPSGVRTRFVSPTNAPLPEAAMGGYSIGTAMILFDAHSDSETGIFIGAVVAVFLAFRAVERLTVAALDVVATICAIIQTIHIIHGDEYDALKATYRAALLLLVFTCFVLGTLVFGRASALKGGRGMALLGIVEIVGFIARPTGADLLTFGAIAHVVFVLVACGAALLLGWAASEWALGLVGIAVLAATVLENAPGEWLGVVAGVAAVCFTVVARRFTRLGGL